MSTLVRGKKKEEDKNAIFLVYLELTACKMMIHPSGIAYTLSTKKPKLYNFYAHKCSIQCMSGVASVIKVALHKIANPCSTITVLLLFCLNTEWLLNVNFAKYKLGIEINLQCVMKMGR